MLLFIFPQFKGKITTYGYKLSLFSQTPDWSYETVTSNRSVEIAVPSDVIAEYWAAVTVNIPGAIPAVSSQPICKNIQKPAFSIRVDFDFCLRRYLSVQPITRVTWSSHVPFQ